MSGKLIEYRIRNYLAQLGKGQVTLSEDLIDEYTSELTQVLKDNKARDEFTLRMSNLGRPICQLLAEKAKLERSPPEPAITPVRLSTGHLLEGWLVMIIKAAGINIDALQVPCSLEVNGATIRGTCDIIIDGVVYDIKTSSQFSFKKFKDGFYSVKDNDPFGYVTQGYAYAEALGKSFGGWIVINKNNGDVTVCEAPSVDEAIKAEALNNISEVVSKVNGDTAFFRAFEDEPEKFRNNLTGNRKLPFTCSYCEYRKHCWPDAIEAPSAFSTAMTPPIVHYSSLVKEKRKDEEGNYVIVDVE